MADPWPLASHQSRRWSFGRGLKVGLASVVVGLVLVGQVMFVVHAVSSGGSAFSVGSVAAHGTFAQRLNAALSAALGAGDRGVRRYRLDGIRPDPAQRGLKEVDVTWAINDDLSAGSVGNGAEVDVYAVLRNIYTAQLPVGTVRLTGTYPVGRSGEAVVMRLSMDRKAATTIGAVGWDNLDPQTLWPLVNRRYVAPDLQPLAGE